MEQTTFSHRGFLLKIYVASIIVVLLYLALYPILKQSVVKLTLIGTLGIALLGGYFVALRSKRFVGSSHYYIVCCYLILLLNAGATGGIGTPGIIWFIFCPLVAFITLTTRIARLWLVIILLTVALLFTFGKTVSITQLHDHRISFFVSYILFFPMVYFVMRIFRREVSKKNVELNLLNQRLQAEREMLEKTQMEILSQTGLIKDAETRALERSSKLSYYLDQLIEVKRMEEVHTGNLEYAVQGILEFLQKSMALKNVAMWHLNANGQPLHLFRYIGDGRDLYERALLCRDDFADAYDMLQTGAIITGADYSKEAMQMKYLFTPSTGNDSMINCPYFLDGRFAGFISCRASEKSWAAEDIIFVRAISDSISLSLKSYFRIVQQQMLEQKQREITEINESLERKVMERTVELNKRNRHLTEFAFTNAHHIRGPICRLLGLNNILASTDDCKDIIKIANYMSVSIMELDQITKQTSEKLNSLVEE